MPARTFDDLGLDEPRRGPSRFAWSMAIVCVLLAVLVAIDARWLSALDYRRDAIAGGAAWRLVTGHLVHLSAIHASLDVSGLLLVAWIFAAEVEGREQVGVCIVGVAIIDAALWFAYPDVAHYAGLSGVLHAWFAAGATRWAFATTRESRAVHGLDLAHRKRISGVLLLAGLGVKLGLELRGSAFWLDGASFPVVTAAHRWGAVAGVLCGGGLAWFRRRAVRVAATNASPDR